MMKACAYHRDSKEPEDLFLNAEEILTEYGQIGINSTNVR